MGHSVQFWGALDEFGLDFGALWVNFEALLVEFWGTLFNFGALWVNLGWILSEFWGTLGFGALWVNFGLDFGALQVNFEALWVNFGAL